MLADFGIIVEFALVGNPNVTSFVGQGLPSVGHIDHRKPPDAERDARLLMDVFVVRTPVGDGTGHPQQRLFGKVPTASQIERTRDSTHLYSLSFKVPVERVYSFRRRCPRTRFPAC